MCDVIGIGRSTYYYKSRRSDQADLEVMIKDIAYSRVHYGYRRVHIMLLRKGVKISRNKVFRLYRSMNLQLRRKKPKRRVQAKPRDNIVLALKKNDIWGMDFVSAQLFNSKRFRVLTIVDIFTKESPGIGIKVSYRAEDVVKTLDRAIRLHGKPSVLRIDNGPEFVSKVLDLWAYENGVILDFTRPGKPTDNAFIESFNGRFRQECLNQHWFLTLADAKMQIERWWREYNSHRPHSSLGYKTPQEFSALQKKLAKKMNP